MTHNEFKLWISGYIRLSTEDSITRKQVNIIQNHAALVKVVDGYLDQKLTCFLSDLDRCFLNNNIIPFGEFKKIGMQLEVYFEALTEYLTFPEKPRYSLATPEELEEKILFELRLR
jgi:hypothetical protein